MLMGRIDVMITKIKWKKSNNVKDMYLGHLGKSVKIEDLVAQVIYDSQKGEWIRDMISLPLIREAWELHKTAEEAMEKAQDVFEQYVRKCLKNNESN